MEDIQVSPLQSVYEGLAAKNPQLKELGFESFREDMKDSTKLQSLYEGLSTKNPQLKERGFDGFKTDMFGGVQEEQPKVQQPVNLSEEKPAQPLSKIDQLKQDYIAKTRGKDFVAPENSTVRSVTGELKQQAKQGFNEVVAAGYGIPGYAYDFVGAGLRALGLPVPTYKESLLTKDVNVGGVDINPLSILDQAKENLLVFAKQNSEEVRKLNPEIDRGVIEPIQKGDYGTGVRNLFSSITQSAPASAAMMLSGGMSVPAQVGAGAALFGSQSMNQADQSGDYGNVSRDAVVAITSVTGALESIFETSFGSGAAGKAIFNIIKKDGEKEAVNTVKKGFTDNIIKLITENPWMAPFGEAYEEMGTQIAQNAVNKYSGYQPDINIMDGVWDAGIMGFGMGAVHGGLIEGAKRITGFNRQESQGSDTTVPEGNIPPTDQTQFTVNPRDTKQAEFYQMGKQYAHKQTGLITQVEATTPEGQPNTPYIVMWNDPTGGMIVQDMEGNERFLHENDITGDPFELSVDDFVSQQMAVYDQTEQNKELLKKNQVQVDGIQYILTGDQTNEGYVAINPEDGSDVVIPTATIQNIQGSGRENANIVSKVYGKQTVSGIKNEDGSLTVSEPATEEQANALKEQVEKSTGGKATVQAELIPNDDATAPQQFQLTIIPKVKEPINNESVTTPPSQDNGLKAEATDELFSPPTERKVITQTIGKDQIDFVENQDYDEVVPTDKMPLEKALPILEKKFKDNPDYTVISEKVQVEVPGKVIKGETKWDKDIIEPSTFKTVVKSIKIVPKEVIAIQKQADTNILLDILDEFNATPESRSDKQAATDIESIAKKLGYQTERNAMNQIRLFDASGTIEKPNVSENNNSENVNSENVSKTAEQQPENQLPIVNSESESSQINQLQNKESEKSLPEVERQPIANEGENTPQAQQGERVQEGLEENVINSLTNTLSNGTKEAAEAGQETGKQKELLNSQEKGKEQPAMISTTVAPVAEQINQAASEVNTNPTEAQKEAGNYKMGHVKIHGMDITIENPKGSVRKGTDEDGKAWEHTMTDHYGYFKQTTGKDGDHIDTFIGDNPESQTIFVVDQNNPKTGAFDESKVMLGYNSPEEAKTAYLSNYEPGWKGFGNITPISIEDFKTWLYDGARQRKPFAEYKSTPEPVSVTERFADASKTIKQSVKKSNSITGKAKEVEVAESDIQGLALQYFVNGGTVHPDEILRMYRDSKTERNLRNSYADQEGLTVAQIAHNIWEALPENIQNGLGEMDVYNTVESVIRSHNTPTLMAQALLKKYLLDPNQGYSKEWLDEQVRKEDEERQAELELWSNYLDELEKTGELPTENELIELFLPENIEDGNQEINQRGNIELDRPANPEGNDQIGENIQGGESGVNGENEGEVGSEIENKDIATPASQQNSALRGSVLLKKEPWQMTKKEFAVLKEYNPDDLPNVPIQKSWEKTIPIVMDVVVPHAKAVQKALSEGKPVPQEVLNDYPDLINPENKIESSNKLLDQDRQKPLLEVLSDSKKEVQEKKPKGITTVYEESNGNVLVYGTKTSQTRLSVEGLSSDEIKEELDFEKNRKTRAEKEIPEQEEYLRTKMITDVSIAVDEALKANRKTIEITKVTIPWLEKKLSEKQSTPLPEEPKKPLMDVLKEGKNDVMFRIDKSQTNSPEFKQWFGKSVFTENGKVGGVPMVLYHGTDRNFDYFRPDRMIYLTPSAEYANMYTAGQSAKGAHYVGKSELELAEKTYSGESIMPVFARAENPFDTRNPKHKSIFQKEYFGKYGNGAPLDPERGLPDWTDAEDLQEFFDEKGYDFDGLVLAESHGNITYAVFTPNQVKSATGNSGQFSLETNNINFKRSSNQEENNLVAVHNIKPAGLLNANRLGGLPMPSIAIVDVNNGFDKYGDITLIADKNFIDPKKNRYSKVFASDVYSARYPNLNYVIPTKGNNFIIKKVNDVLPIGITSDVINRIKNAISEGGVRDLARSEYAQLLFLADTKRQFEIKYSEPKFPESIKKAFIDNGWKNLEYYEINDNNEVKKQLTGLYTESIPSKQRKESMRFLSEDGILNSNIMRNFMRDVQNDIRDAGKVDNYSTVRAASEYIQKSNLQDEFEAYVANLYDEIGVEEKIFRGYSNSGNRLYSPHTLENVLKEMKKDGIRGGEKFGYGAGNVRAQVTPEFKSIPEIQKNRGQIIPFEDDMKSTANDELIEVMDNLKKFYKYESGSFGYYDNASDELVQLARSGRSESFKPIDEESRKMVADFLNKLANLPTEYFEAKINRGVSLAEFKNALIPENTSPEIRDILKFNGINAVEYKDNEDRAEKLKQLANEQNLSFRIIGETGAANLDKAEEATTRLDNLKVAREMEQAGKDVKSIRLATGWEKGVDGKWRYEVPDFEFSEGVTKMISNQGKYGISETWVPNKIKLSEVINDKELFKAYPEFENVEVSINVRNDQPNKGSFTSDLLDVDLGNINVQANSFANFKSILAHEIQHGIQLIEGFARGGNKASAISPYYSSINARLSEISKEIDKYKLQFNKDKVAELQAEYDKLMQEKLSANSYDHYKRLAGEVESRNVQTRMNMTPEERLNTLLSETEDVAREDQIVLMEGLGVSNLESQDAMPIIDYLENNSTFQSGIQYKTIEEFINDIEGKLTKEEIEDIKNSNFSAISYNNDIVFNSQAIQSTDDIIKSWAHEKSHIQLYRKFNFDGNKKKKYFTELYNKVGKNEIKRVLPKEYWKDDIDTQGEEYLVHLAESYAVTGKISNQVMPEIRKEVENLVNSFTTLKNIQDAKNNRIDLSNQKEFGRNENARNGNRRGIQSGVGDNGREELQERGSLQDNESGTEKPSYKLNTSLPLSDILSQAKQIVQEKKSELSLGEKPMTEKEFNKKYNGQHKDIRSKDNGNFNETLKQIQKTGFRGGAYVLPIYQGGNPTNIIQSNYGNKKGDFIYLVPKEWIKTHKLNPDTIKEGWKPTDNDVIEIEYDNQSSYEAYLNKQAKKSLPETINIDGIERPTLNSNGKPIAQTEEGIRNFWKWFGDSKVVDDEGRPLVVYHGTDADFNEFDPNKEFNFFSAIFTSPIYSDAQSYGDNVKELYVKLENPAPVNEIDNVINIDNITQRNRSALLAQKGYDGFENYFEKYEYVVFDSSQIKSASGNNGSFSPQSNNINFSKETELPLKDFLSNAAEQYKEKKRTRRNLAEVKEKVREFIQDHDLPIRRLEEKVKELGGTIKDNMKPYRDMSNSYGRNETLYKNFSKDKMEPIIKTISKIIKSGVDGIEILPYMISKHAIERNAYMRENEFKEWEENAKSELQKWTDVNIDIPQATKDRKVKEFNDESQAKRAELQKKDYSGVKGFDPENRFDNPDELAQAIVDEFEDKVPIGLVDELWDNVKEASSDIVNFWKAGQTMSAEQAEITKNRFKYFIPLRGWREGAAKQLAYKKGDGFAGSLQRAKGRKSFAENPLAYLQQTAFKAIGEQVDNEVKTSLLNLVTGNYDAEFQKFYHLKKAYYVKVNLPDGTFEWEMTINRPSEEMFASGDAKTKIYEQYQKLRTPSQAHEHEVYIKRPNGDMIVVMSDEMLPVAQAMNHKNTMYRNIFTGQINDAEFWNKPLSATIGRANNWLKGMYTAWNVVFPLTNFARDIQEASITQFIKGDSGEKVLANYKNALPAIIRDMRGKEPKGKYGDYLKEFRLAGGNTGYTHLKTPEQLEKEINSQLKITNRKGTFRGYTLDQLVKAKGAVEAWNQVFEDATRLSVYITSRENGKSMSDAASDAKEASVNFNRKGKLSKAFDSVWAFWNVAIQSMQKNFKLAKDYPGRFGIVAGSWLALGFLEAMLNDFVGGDDDEDYYNISDYVRENYLIIPNIPALIAGEKSDKYLRIPLSQFWRGFKSSGSIAYDVYNGKMDALTASGKAISNFLGGLLPIDIGGFVQDGEFSVAPIVPTIYRPIREVRTNRDYMGFKIAKEPFTKEQEARLADSGLGKDNVNPAIKFATDWLFRAGGGDNENRFYSRNGVIKEVPGFMDINPSMVEHLITGYTGGTGRFIDDVLTTAMQATMPDQEVDFKNAPFLNSFFKKIPEVKWKIIGEYYDMKSEGNESKFDALTNSYFKLDDKTKYMELAPSGYYNEFNATLDAYDQRLTTQMQFMDYKTAEGSEEVVNTMKEAIKALKEVKQKYNWK